jgi:hypothetical protein
MSSVRQLPCPQADGTADGYGAAELAAAVARGDEREGTQPDGERSEYGAEDGDDADRKLTGP